MDTITSQSTVAAEVVAGKTEGYRVIVLYPRHRQHSALISLLHSYYSDQMLYYTFNEEDTDLKAFLWNLSHDAMFPVDFGHEVRAAIQTSDSAQEWGRALARDLAGLDPNQQYMLLLDGFDLLPRDEESTQQFFTGIAEELPDNIQVVVNGKELRRHPWVDLINSEVAIALGDDETLGAGIFQDESLKGNLEVYALSGGSRVIIDGRPITAWEGSLPRNLFYYFVDKNMVTRAEVFESFWPNLGIKEATNVFHVTKRKISEKIGYDLTSYENGFYVHNTDHLNILYDVDIFEKHIDKAMKASDEAEIEEHLKQAVQVYRGQFLKEVNMEWAYKRREQLRDSYAQALISLAEMYRNRGELDRALGYYIRATGEKPDREDVYRAVMEIYAQQGKIDEIHIQYQTLENILDTKLDITPSQETQELYQKLT